MSSLLATAVKIAVALGVVLAAFWLTLWLWDAQGPPDRDVIMILDATYGMSCTGFAVPPGQQNRVKAGNVTPKVREICEDASVTCDFSIDVSEMGDPAPGCGKDFSISWRCGTAGESHQIRIVAEANGKPVLLRCP